MCECVSSSRCCSGSHTAVVFDISSQMRLVLTFPALCSKAELCCSCCLSSVRSPVDQRERSDSEMNRSQCLAFDFVVVFAAAVVIIRCSRWSSPTYLHIVNVQFWNYAGLRSESLISFVTRRLEENHLIWSVWRVFFSAAAAAFEGQDWTVHLNNLCIFVLNTERKQTTQTQGKQE